MRIKGSPHRKRTKKLNKLAKGYYAKLGSAWRMVRQQVPRSLAFQYRDRRDKKGVLRSLWITRLNAAAREHGVSYSLLMNGLKKADIKIDRKILSYLSLEDPKTFKSIVDVAKEHITKKVGVVVS